MAVYGYYLQRALEVHGVGPVEGPSRQVAPPSAQMFYSSGPIEGAAALLPPVGWKASARGEVSRHNAAAVSLNRFGFVG